MIARLTRLRERLGLIAYVTAGDGGVEYTTDCCLALAAAGVDVIELGLPFSDPIADGPVIQQAMTRALRDGVSFPAVLAIAARLRRESDIGLVLFSYWNPLLAAGPELYARAADAGIDGMLTVDLPMEHGAHHADALRRHGLAPIGLVSPTTPTERAARIAADGDGFLYYACRKGITGARRGVPDDLSTQLRRLRAVTALPLAVGFGIGDAQAATDVFAAGADAIVVGSALVARMAKKETPEQLAEFARSLIAPLPMTHGSGISNDR